MKQAFDLLITYGDSIEKTNIEGLMRSRGEKLEASMQDLSIFSTKHKAIYLYLYRVLLPVWNMNITAQPNTNSIRN